MTARKPISRVADMTSERGDKPGITSSVQMIGPWESPAESDRALVRDGLDRNGAVDLAEILGLVDPAPITGPLALTCPTCAAPPGVRCHTTAVRSRLADGHHRARQEAA